MIDLRNVKKVYKSKRGTDTTALDNINFKIGNTGMIFILGKSGSGKSTILNILGGLDDPTSGEVIVNGKDITKFKHKEYDAYRNTYIGFVFQEFNVLEQYNVYSNIELALKLQDLENNKNTIDDILKKLGIEDLGTRKINELSGGQKQRVAIARALVKNPKIILADEPTGNLDQASGAQIFEILKNISKTKPVIIVSHDVEAAKKYADRIIGIEDGNIIVDTNPIVDEVENTLELKKSKLPFSYALKMAISSLKAKPFKLLMTILLTALSLIFTAIAVNCAIFNKSMFISNTMKDNNNYAYTVYKSEFNGNEFVNTIPLDDSDIINIEKLTDSNANIVYSLYDNSNNLEFIFGENNNESRYFNFNIGHINFVELKDNIPYELIGKSPAKPNEIVVHKYFADYIIKFGVIDLDDKLYFPKDYNDIISSKHKLKLGDNSVIITGIIDDDDSLFEEAKETGKFKNRELENYFSFNYVDLSSTIYVNGFVEKAILGYDKNSLINYSYISDNNGNVIRPPLISALNSNVDIITKDEIKTINSLEKSEVILSIDSLKKLDNTFDTKFNDYIKNYTGEVIYDELLKEYIIKYINEYSSKLKIYLSISPKDYEYSDVIENYYNIPLKIVGISTSDNNYISYEYIDEYQPKSKKIYSALIFDKDIKHIQKSFDKLKFLHATLKDIVGTYYTYSTTNFTDLSNIIGYYDALSIYILIISLVFVFFTLLLFSNFIAVSISYCKKEIGILRALGTTNKDITKIFCYESIIIGLVAWILSTIGWNVVCDILNNSLFGNMYYTLNGIVKHPLVPTITCMFTILIALLITAVSTSRTSKIKPIDAILNK